MVVLAEMEWCSLVELQFKLVCGCNLGTGGIETQLLVSCSIEVAA